MVDVAPTTAHPLDALAADEIRAAVSVVRESGRVDDGVLFAMVTLDEPGRALVTAHKPGDPVDRRVRLIVLPGPEAAVVEVVVSLASGQIVEWTPRDGVRPALLFDDSYRAILALRESPEWQAAMRRRGITDFEQVQIDPWPAGNFGNPTEDGRRITRCLSYYREEPTDNGYARPVEGVLATVDAARGVVLEVIDYGVVPLPPERGSYLPEDHEPLRTDLLPLEIVQPDGPSFTLDGNLLTWQHWTLRVAMDPLRRPGPPHHRLRRRRRLRTILHRACHQRDGRPLRRPGADARLEERLRRRRVGARAHGQLADAGLRLPGRDPLPRRRLRQRARHAVRHRATPCASTRRTTGSSGSTTT